MRGARAICKNYTTEMWAMLGSDPISPHTCEILHRFCKIMLKRAIVIVVLEHSEASVCAVEYVVAVAADVDARSACHAKYYTT